MSRVKYDDRYSYEIFDDGYDIYDGDRKIIVQHDPFGKPMDGSKSYEENCILQIQDMEKPIPEPIPSDPEKLRADLDYMALLMDVELPSEDTTQEGE